MVTPIAITGQLSHNFDAVAALQEQTNIWDWLNFRGWAVEIVNVSLTGVVTAIVDGSESDNLTQVASNFARDINQIETDVQISGVIATRSNIPTTNVTPTTGNNTGTNPTPTTTHNDWLAQIGNSLGLTSLGVTAATGGAIALIVIALIITSRK